MIVWFSLKCITNHFISEEEGNIFYTAYTSISDYKVWIEENTGLQIFPNPTTEEPTEELTEELTEEPNEEQLIDNDSSEES